MSGQAHLAFEFTTQGEPRLLPPESCQHIVGLVQEGLNNVVKHARARHVHITLGWAPDDLSVSLVDDGVGFDPARLPEAGHYGLPMMRERVAALGGDLTVLSAPGQGTQLIFRFPFAQLKLTPQGEAAFANRAAST